MKMLELVAKSKKEAEVILYGTVSQWNSLNALVMLQVVKKAEKEGYERLTLRILNSPGGSIFEGLAIMSVMEETNLITVARIESMAASMASAIAMGCDEVHMAKGARLMIHQGSAGAYGSARQILNTGKLLASLNDTLAEVYAAKSGKEKQWVLDNWMAEGQDSWMTASEAQKAGLVDVIFGNKVKPAKTTAEGSFDFDAMVAHYDQQVEDLHLLDDESVTDFTMNIFEKFPKLAALVGKKPEEITSEVIQAVNEELTAKGLQPVMVVSTGEQEALTTQAQKDADQVTALNAVLGAVAKALDPEHKGEVTQDAITGKITGLQKELTDAKAEIVKLGGQAGATHTQPPKPGDKLDDEDSPEDEISSLAHNRALDNNPLFN